MGGLPLEMMERSGTHTEGHVSTLMWSWRRTTTAGNANPSLWPEPKATASATAAALAASQSLATTMERSRGLGHFEATGCCVPHLAGYRAHGQNSSDQGNNLLSHPRVGVRLDPKATEWCGTDTCVYRVTGHLPLASPGYDEADTLAQMCWLEG